MAQAPTSDTELLTEHLGYAPVSLLDNIINIVNSLADRTLDRVEQGLSGATPKTLGFEKSLKKQQQQRQQAEQDLPPTAEDAAALEVADGVHKLETLLCNAIDKNFDIFELYVMRYLICVNPSSRSWIRLTHYGGLDFDAAEREDTPSAESVNAVRRNLQGSRRLNAMLHAEKARNAELLAKLRTAVGGPGTTKTESDADETKAPLGFLHNKGALADADAQTPITTSTAFTLSQLQALRALSTSLQNLMPDLKGGAAAPDDDGASGGEVRKGWRRERMEYVQTATKKHLENVRGLELSQNGSVRDGEWQGEGRNLAKGDVEALENAVALLGGEAASKTIQDAAGASGA